MFISQIISSVSGVVTGIIQDVLHSKAEAKAKKDDLEIFKQKQDYLLELDRQRSDLLKEELHLKSNIETSKAEQSEDDFESARINAITNATKYIKTDNVLIEIANFIVTITRPLLTFLLTLLIFYIYKTQITFNPIWLSDFIEAIMDLYSWAFSFWFFRRSMDKLRSK